MDLSTVYTPETTEEKWYALWEEKGLFGSRPDPARDPFTIVIPPPNVTGSLHMGHALNNTLQDVLIRWNKLNGKNTLWIPGTDHGGIATQNVVEKLLKKEGKSRHDLGRRAFLEKMWSWRKDTGDTILHQLRKLGCALDWSRTRFTMDDASSRAVHRAFVELHRRNLVYLGKRLVNWCPRCATALSDIEVEYAESAGSLWHLRYPLEGGGEIPVATTRPETMLGDTAVAVNPADARYAGLQGKKILLPLREESDSNRRIPLVYDAAVDASFGSGAVKVTPAHDAVDADIGERHRLPSLTVIGYDGKMTPAAGPYAGLSVKEARAKIVADLEAQGFLIKTEAYKNNVASCYRCQTVIEPLESSQWFVKTADMARRAAEATETAQVRIHPDSWAKPYLHWLRNNKDWCVSRQIWWGHQIPIWYCRPCLNRAANPEEKRRLNEDPEFLSQWTKEDLRRLAVQSGNIHVAEGRPTPCAACGGTDFVQDPDVLDTWFSSGLWPLTTLGWPEETDSLKHYYPTSVLATGHEILYLWVARMVMFGLEFRNDVPYRDVYIHGIVRDKQGRKMSKSLNNVIDPLDVMKKYGTDALRYALVSMASPGRDMQLSDDSFVGARNFANKMWNATRFVLGHLEGYTPRAIPLAERGLPHRWLRVRWAETQKAVEEHMAQFDPSQAARTLYAFFWNDFCDWYIEIGKTHLWKESPEAPPAQGPQADATRQTLVEVLDGVLRALHPFMPFITEELWRQLWTTLGAPPTHCLLDGPPAATSVAPLPTDLGAVEKKEMDLLMETITKIRTLRSEMNVPPGKVLDVVVSDRGPSGRSANGALLTAHAPYVRQLAKVAYTAAQPQTAKPPRSVTAVVTDVEIFMPLEGSIDFEKVRARLSKDVADLETNIARDQERLGNPDFIQRAPEEKVQEVRVRIDDHIAKRDRLKNHLAALN